MCALFLTMVEQFEATARLMEANLVSHAGVHVRSMMEALANFQCLAESPSHVDVMLYKNLEGEKRAYKSAVEAEMLSVEDQLAMATRLTDCNERHSQHKRKLTKEQLNTQMPTLFKRGGVSELLTPYTILCSMAHSDLSALAMRHQGRETMEFRREVPRAMNVLVYSMAHYSLMHALPTLPTIAQFRDGSFERHFNKMVDIHGSLLTELGPPE